MFPSNNRGVIRVFWGNNTTYVSITSPNFCLLTYYKFFRLPNFSFAFFQSKDRKGQYHHEPIIFLISCFPLPCEGTFSPGLTILVLHSSQDGILNSSVFVIYLNDNSSTIIIMAWLGRRSFGKGFSRGYCKRADGCTTLQWFRLKDIGKKAQVNINQKNLLANGRFPDHTPAGKLLMYIYQIMPLHDPLQDSLKKPHH